MKKILIIILILISTIIKSQTTNILYFEGVRKDKVYFKWEVSDKIKDHTFILQGSIDNTIYQDMFSLKTKNKGTYYSIDLITNFEFFRLKEVYKNGTFIYSDVIKIDINKPFSIWKDCLGIFIISEEEGMIIIQDFNKKVIHTGYIEKGTINLKNTYKLNIGIYYIKLIYDTYYYEDTIIIE